MPKQRLEQAFVLRFALSKRRAHQRVFRDFRNQMGTWQKQLRSGHAWPLWGLLLELWGALTDTDPMTPG